MLLALLVTFPVVGMVTLLCVGMLVLQKLRLQTRLDDNRWWLIKYSDIVIIKEPKVGPGPLHSQPRPNTRTLYQL